MGLSVQGGIVLRFLGAQRLLRRNRNVGEDSEMEQVLCVNVMCAYVSSTGRGHWHSLLWARLCNVLPRVCPSV